MQSREAGETVRSDRCVENSIVGYAVAEDLSKETWFASAGTVKLIFG